ncbi:MAG: alpha/beta fold hydrolase [Bacteroidota bacterium]
MPFIALNGCDYYYEIHDNPSAKQTLVFSHGLLWSGKMFWKQVEYLKSRYRVITYDHRGQGKSSATTGGYDMDQLFFDAVALIENLQLGKVHFAGLSMGGFVGLRLAARRPDLLHSLILMETSAQKEAGIFKYSMLVNIVKLLGVKSVTGPVMNIMYGEKFLRDKERTEEKKFWVNELHKNSKNVIRAVKGIIRRKGVEKELKKILCPVLVMVGTQDKAAIPARAEFIHKHIPHSKLQYIEGAGHSSSVEEPEQVNRCIEEFLNTVLLQSVSV